MRSAPPRFACLLAIGTTLSLPAYALSHPGARPGEAFTYKFSVGPVESGRARMSIGEVVSKAGRRLIAVHGEAETAPWLQLILRIKDDYQLVIDAATLLPRSVITVEEGARNRRISSVLDGRALEIDVQAKERAGHALRNLPRVARDPLSSLFALRAAPLKDGDVLTFDVIDGPALWRCTLWVRARESIRLDRDRPGAPARRAIKIDGELKRIDDLGRFTAMPPRHLVCWLSDDADRVLLRSGVDTDLGRATIELTGFDPPPRKKELPPDLVGIVFQP